MGRFTAVSLVIGLVLSGCAGTPGRPTPREITLLHFNDFHSQMEPWSEDGGPLVGGVAYLAGAANRVRDERPRALLLDAGDNVQGTPYFNFFRGAAECDVLNALGVDAMTLGNHEFDNGTAALQAMLKPARFPVVSTNVVSTEALPVKPFARFDLDGVRVTVIGVTTQDLDKVVLPSRNPGLRAAPVVSSVRPWVERLRGDTDLLVVLSHCGLESDSVLAVSVPGIDVIVAGHDHEALHSPRRIPNDNGNGIEGTLLVEAGSRGEWLGRLDLRMDGRRIAAWDGSLVPIGPERSPEDPDVAEVIARYAERLGPELADTLATAPQGLSAEGRFERQIALGALIADAMREAVGANIALQNGGGIRTSVAPGPVCVRDVYAVLPFENTIVKCIMTGRQIEELLAFGLAHRGAGAYPQLSGITFTDSAGIPRDVRVGGEPLDPQERYSVATLNYLFQGGDGYTLFAGAQAWEDTGLTVRDAFTELLKRRKIVSPAAIERR
jgi:2',3'-cyclic-nucleotide 2'-phosphodiesterase (5'-nucleotidase family)